MMYLVLLVCVILLYVLWDVNYFVRSVFTILYRRCYDPKAYYLEDVTTITGICTFQDCDISFSGLRLCRLLRELDIARYHFYDCTGIIGRSSQYNISSLQGGTLVLHFELIPMFVRYRIHSKLVYWDERSLFIEHEVVTERDNKIRALIVSRQFAISATCEAPVENLIRALWETPRTPNCPDYIQSWIKSMEISSAKLRAKSKLSLKYLLVFVQSWLRDNVLRCCYFKKKR